MRCSCPKCNSVIDIDSKDIPADGSFSNCPECGAGYNLHQESFAHRALRKGDEITCAECGSVLGPATFCQACHALYPDYFVTESSSAAKNQFGKILGKFNSLSKISLSGTAKNKHHERAHVVGTSAPSGGKGPSQRSTLMIVGLVVLVILGTGGFFYYQDKVEKEYAAKYIGTVFTLKTAADMNKRISAQIVTDWKASGMPQPPALSADVQKSLKSAKTDVDKVMKSFPKIPKKYLASKEALDKFNAAYKNMQSLNEAPSGTIDSFTNAATKLADDFRKSGAAIKSSMPEKLATAFAEGKKMYPNLSDM